MMVHLIKSKCFLSTFLLNLTQILSIIIFLCKTRERDISKPFITNFGFILGNSLSLYIYLSVYYSLLRKLFWKKITMYVQTFSLRDSKVLYWLFHSHLIFEKENGTHFSVNSYSTFELSRFNHINPKPNATDFDSFFYFYSRIRETLPFWGPISTGYNLKLLTIT